GVTMVLQGALDSPVSAVFSNLPLDEGIRRLTRWHSVVMIYDPADGAKDPALTEVWVTGSIRSEVAAGDRPRNQVRAEASTSVDSSDYAGDSPGLSTALSKLNDDTRREQIEVLMRAQGEYAVVNALRETALLDPGSITRYRAIQALASMQNPLAVDALRSLVGDLRATVTTSSDPRIRRQAVQVLASINSPEAVDALRATLGDPHPAVAAEARRALVRQSRAGEGNSVR